MRRARGRAGGRAVSPIIAEILLVAITVVLVAVLYVLITGYTTGQARPLGSSLSVGEAKVGNGPSPTMWYENLSVESAASGLTISNLKFGVQTPTGGVIAPPAGSTILLVNVTGSTEATYTFSSGSWTGGGAATAVTSQDGLHILWLAATPSDPLSGNYLVISGSDGFQGTESVLLA